MCIPYPCIEEYFILTLITNRCIFINIFNHILLLLFTNKVWLVGHPGDGHRSDRNMLVKNNM